MEVCWTINQSRTVSIKPSLSSIVLIVVVQKNQESEIDRVKSGGSFKLYTTYNSVARYGSFVHQSKSKAVKGNK